MPQEYTRAQTRIVVGIGDEFLVALAANPTTGYEWQPEFDPAMLELAGRAFSPPGDGMGQGGVERFRFVATAAGPTRLAFAYRRAWEQSPVDEAVFDIMAF